MRMRQSLAQFEEAFLEEAKASVQRRERLRRQAAQRSRVRRKQRVEKQGTWRFAGLAAAIVATSVLVTVAMFQTLALLVG
jgi:anti-sigma-K factor RskA